MRPTPITLGDHEVQDLLAGELATATRPAHLPPHFRGERCLEPYFEDGVQWWHEPGRAGFSMHCPYGQPGDLLWVREAVLLDKTALRDPARPLYRADECQGDPFREVRWTPPSKMPKWASRFTLALDAVQSVESGDPLYRLAWRLVFTPVLANVDACRG